jgi:membrane protease subunit HflC
MTRLLVIAGVLIGLWAGLVAAGNVGLGPLVITREGEQKLILLLGDVRKVTEPGWALRLPLLEDVEKYDRRLLFLDSEPLPIQTRDEERIVIDNYAVWRIDDPVAFRRSFPAGMAQAQSRIDRAVRNDVREVIGRQTLADVLKDERVAIMREITEQTQATLSQEGDEKARRIRAEAEREARVIVAEAHRDAEIVRGEGDAAATQIYGEAYGEAPEFYAFVRTLEAYRKTLGSDTTLVTSPRSDFFRFLDAADGAAGQR